MLLGKFIKERPPVKELVKVLVSLVVVRIDHTACTQKIRSLLRVMHVEEDNAAACLFKHPFQHGFRIGFIGKIGEDTIRQHAVIFFFRRQIFRLITKAFPQSSFSKYVLHDRNKLLRIIETADSEPIESKEPEVCSRTAADLEYAAACRQTKRRLRFLVLL